MATTSHATKRRTSTVVHMLVAMLVLFVPVVLLTQFFTRNPEPPVTALDWKPVADAAAREASYEVLAPVNLPDGWVATRARFTEAGQPVLAGDPAPGDTFQLGFLSPEGRYFGLDQRDAAPDAFVRTVTRQGRPDGESSAAGRSWTRYVSEDGRTRSLVELREGAATIVSADLPHEALEAFASTLEPVRA